MLTALSLVELAEETKADSELETSADSVPVTLSSTVAKRFGFAEFGTQQARLHDVRFVMIVPQLNW